MHFLQQDLLDLEHPEYLVFPEHQDPVHPEVLDFLEHPADLGDLERLDLLEFLECPEYPVLLGYLECLEYPAFLVFPEFLEYLTALS